MSMTGERKSRAREMLTALREDIEADVNKREGMPFTGHNVAEALGEICAQIDAIAMVLQEMLEVKCTCDKPADEITMSHRPWCEVVA